MSAVKRISTATSLGLNSAPPDVSKCVEMPIDRTGKREKSQAIRQFAMRGGQRKCG